MKYSKKINLVLFVFVLMLASCATDVSEELTEKSKQELFSEFNEAKDSDAQRMMPDIMVSGVGSASYVFPMPSGVFVYKNTSLFQDYTVNWEVFVNGNSHYSTSRIVGPLECAFDAYPYPIGGFTVEIEIIGDGPTSPIMGSIYYTGMPYNLCD